MMTKTITLIIALTIFSSLAFALPSIQKKYIMKYPFLKNSKLDSCTTCHMPANDEFLNYYGADMKRYQYNFRKLEGLDSDRDGTSNIREMRKRQYPGSRSSKDSEIFVMHNRKGDVAFNHAAHLINKNYKSGFKCNKCHFKDGFRKRFKSIGKRYQIAHTVCINCHIKSKRKRAPKKCVGCHNASGVR